LIADQFRNDLFRQESENFRVAEEAGDVDEQILGQKDEFVCVVLQQRKIAVPILGLFPGHPHAVFDTTLQGTGFVEPEVMRGHCSKKFDNFRQQIIRRRWSRAISRGAGRHSPSEFDNRFRNLRRGEHSSTDPVAMALRGMPS